LPELGGIAGKRHGFLLMEGGEAAMGAGGIGAGGALRQLELGAGSLGMITVAVVVGHHCGSESNILMMSQNGGPRLHVN
jgi:hypothetical protein